MLKDFEVLAPVGNKESFMSAINCGADALYLGVDVFNARANIANFSLEELDSMLSYAHLFGVKIYLTLNILFYDNEFAQVDKIVSYALENGVDGFIIQDIGLYYYLKNRFPNAPLHASTQMGICNLEGAKFVESLGFERVVLARETSLPEIARVSQGTKLDIEYFVQGALCISFSGNCYLSSLLAGCSGNRGKCKQFCRLPFSISNGKEKKEGFLLSAKDFCMSERLADLAKAGVKSFKIEGRARRATYVGQAVRTYKSIIQNGLKGQKIDRFNLAKVFNRGNFTDGYFSGQNIIYPQTQNHIGVEIGYVKDVKKGKKFNEITIFSTHNLQKGDAIKFFVGEKEVDSMAVHDVKNIGKNLFILTGKALPIKNGKVNLIVDSVQEEEISNIYRKIEVNAHFEAKVGQKAVLTFEVNNVSVSVTSDEVCQKALTRGVSEENCQRQFAKLGKAFVLNNIDCEMEDVFIPLGQLNELRRKAEEQLQRKMLEQYNEENHVKERSYCSQTKILLEDKPFDSCKMFVFDNREKLVESFNHKDIFVYSPSEYNRDEISSLCKKVDGIIFLSLPVMAREEDIVFLKSIFAQNDNLGLVANNYYALSLLPKEKMIIGSDMNVVNSYAVKFYVDNGYNKIILSPELDDRRVASSGGMLFAPEKFYPEYMNFAHCPVKEHLGGNCGNCRYTKNIRYNFSGKEFILVRRKMKSCQFVLKGNIPLQRKVFVNPLIEEFDNE